MSDFDQSHVHRRFNPLMGEWVKVSPHRTKRPWQGQVEKNEVEERPQYDEKCYLCPGNERAGGAAKNPAYESTYVFNNDFAAILPDTPEGEYEEDGLFHSRNERGICRVICFSPRHDLTLSLMERTDIVNVIKTWQDEYKSLGAKDFINHVQIFENRGAMMGCSNPHPHGQIWAEELIPEIPGRELARQKAYLEEKGSCLLCDYVNKELAKEERIVFQNDSFAALVPFWAFWPFETMILPKRHIGNLTEMTDKERDDLADALKRMGTRFDNLFSTHFPYSMGIHQTPTDGREYPEVHMHIHYYPPLLRSATVRKFQVGYEMLAMSQRDITPEQAAVRLRDSSEIHFLEAK